MCPSNSYASSECITLITREILDRVIQSQQSLFRVLVIVYKYTSIRFRCLSCMYCLDNTRNSRLSRSIATNRMKVTYRVLQIYV